MLVSRLWPLLVIMLLMWLILLAVMLVKYGKLSNKMMAAEMDHSAVIANISSSLRNAEVTHKETKARMEVDLAELRARMEAFSKCPQGWMKYESHCYLFSSVFNTWEAARSDCRSQNADLVIVNTKQEQNFLAQNLNSNSHWIGLTDSAVEGTWLWVSGEPLNIKFWRQGEPNNEGPQFENCAIINPRNNWNDISCSDNCRWICEKGLL